VSLGFLRPYVWRQRRALALGVVVSILAAAGAALGPYILSLAVDSLQRSGVELASLARYSLLLVLAGCIDGLFGFCRRMLFGVAAYQVEFDLRDDLFAQLLRLDQRFYSEMYTGDLMARATNDLSAVRMFLGPGLSSLALATCTLLASAVLMLQVDWQIALIVLLLLPMTSLVFVVLGWRMQRIYRGVQEHFGNLSTRAQENFSGIRTIKAYAQEDAEVGVFAIANEAYRRQNLRYVLLSGLLWPAMVLALGLVSALVLFLGGQRVATGQLSLGDLVLFIAYLGLLSWPMIALGWTVNLYQQAAASIGRIAEVIGRAPNVADPVGAFVAGPVRGDVAFRNVSLTLNNQQVLRDVSLHVPAGTSLAIVGATGAGKSCLVNLLGRVRDPDAGQVLVGGIDVRQLPLAELRRAIGYVPQETFLFSVPLRENLLFGYEGQGDTDALIERAVEVSQLVNDMPQFPQGLDTLVGERGVTLSGGQKQRATIARALVRDPAILILDDALSSVDTYTAARILEGLRGFMGGRTSIIISQRITTIKAADQIVVMDHGGIVERGTHRELLQAGGRYAGMYRRELLQSELEESVEN
jgi:ATP-binding cassette, subfamily B, multidrug efflux pump